MAGRALRLLGVAAGMVVIFTVLLGIIYPLAMTGAAQALFPDKADGSLVKLDGEVVGSELAGQVFTSPAYFHTRPSATTPPDNPSATTFANLGPNTIALAGGGRRLHLRRPEARAALQPRAAGAGPAGGHDHDVRVRHRPPHLGRQRPAAGRPRRGGPRRARPGGCST